MSNILLIIFCVTIKSMFPFYRTFGILILGGIMLEKEGLKCLTEEYDGDHDRNCEYGLHIKSVP